ncbi:hypothetical protein TNIN_199061 [Trichonephila inaurata madagascariensis]|uniref:Gustatory receptor n=1 Tax=Trichonephila inaurata madagascariensis TaxID=2747483 RepID=A0A8X6YLF8_9ARAC|nr:hypothetical protein TNIN_199061 [Trichonephila inaurata madagascariensis]
MTSTAACFTFMCIQIQALFTHMSKQIRNLKEGDDFYRLFNAYNELTGIVNLVDDVFSYSALVIVVNCMTGLFRVIYLLVFVQEVYIHSDFSFLFYGAVLFNYIAERNFVGIGDCTGWKASPGTHRIDAWRFSIPLPGTEIAN